ncbi:MAG TPA: hypothetical protein VEX15_18380 [Nocardioidaceae bacterium]|nr:hypothetical protein [Nocardioidaceae bacterium]
MVTTVLDLAGAGCLIAAAYLIYMPAGIAALGLALLAASANFTRTKKAVDG